MNSVYQAEVASSTCMNSVYQAEVAGFEASSTYCGFLESCKMTSISPMREISHFQHETAKIDIAKIPQNRSVAPYMQQNIKINIYMATKDRMRKQFTSYLLMNTR